MIFTIACKTINNKLININNSNTPGAEELINYDDVSYFQKNI